MVRQLKISALMEGSTYAIEVDMYKKIAVVVDGSTESEHALRAAVSLATVVAAEVIIVAIIKPLPIYAAYAESAGPQVSQILDDDHRSFYVKLQINAASIAAEANVAHSYHTVEGLRVESIVDIVRSHASDLLVIGLHSKGSLIARLWSTAYELAQDAPCSVLGVH